MSERLRVLTGRTFSSLQVRNYRLFFWGQMVSNTGTWMQTVAQSWLVLNLTNSGSALGLTVGLQFLPLLLFGVWGGLIADRFDKRRTLIVTQSCAAVLALVLWTLVVTHVVELWMVYGLVFLYGCFIVVDLPTRQAFVTEMVGEDQLPNAIGLNSAVFNSARLIGPAVAGIIIDRFGVAPAFMVNALSFLAVIAGLTAMRPHELFSVTRVERGRHQVREGIRYVWETPALRSTLLLVTLVAAFGFNFVVVLPLLAKHTFHGGAALYGGLSAAMALGSVLGALGTAARGSANRMLLIASAGVFGVITMVSAAAPSAIVAGLLLVPIGAALIVFIATANTTLQLKSSPEMRGRVMAIYGLVFLGSNPVGAPVLGWICQHWGARAGLLVGGAVSITATAIAVVGLRRHQASAEAAATTPPRGVELAEPRIA